MFNYEVPRAKYQEDSYRDTKGDLVLTQTRIRPCTRKATKDRRVIVHRVEYGVEYQYHATKGWRINKP